MSIGSHLSTILLEIIQPSIIEITVVTSYLKFLSIIPGANELIWSICCACLVHHIMELCIKWCDYHQPYINSLGPGKFKWNFRHVIFKQIVVIGGWGISCEITLIWMSLVFTDDQSILVHVMAWCRQATSHYLSQCWPRFISLYGVTSPLWVNNVDNITKAYIYLVLSWYGSSWWRHWKLWYPLGMFLYCVSAVAVYIM